MAKKKGPKGRADPNPPPIKGHSSSATIKTSRKAKGRSMSESMIPSSSSSRKAENSQNKSSGTNQSAIPIDPKLEKRFYEQLVMLYILGSNRGEHLDEEAIENVTDHAVLNSMMLQREFLKNLAYLCDFEKGGETTTSIAVQQTPEYIKYWFASNRGFGERDKTKEFLNGILLQLAEITNRSAHAIEEECFDSAVSFTSKRLADYVRHLLLEVRCVLQDLTSRNEEQDQVLVNWLKQLKQASTSQAVLCRFCFEARHSPECGELSTRSAPGKPYYQRYEQIRHYIGRLSHTLKAVKNIVGAAVKLPRLFDGIQVIRARSFPSSPPPLRERNPSLHAIAGRMTSDANTISELRSALQEMDQKHHLSKHLSDQCLKPTWRPQVHAELILLDLFYTNEFEFLGNDRYIACSKSACYCCYHYIHAHPGGFVQPAGHSNLWINWRPPDIIMTIDPHRRPDLLVKIRENVLNNMTAGIRNEVMQQIWEKRGPAKKKADSNTMISSMRSVAAVRRRSRRADQVAGRESDQAWPGIEESEGSCGSESEVCNRERSELEDEGFAPAVLEIVPDFGDEIDEREKRGIVLNETELDVLSIDEKEDEDEGEDEDEEEQQIEVDEDSEDESDEEGGGVPLFAMRTI